MILVNNSAQNSINEIEAVFDVLLEFDDIGTSGLGEVVDASTPQITKVQYMIKHFVKALMKHLVLE